MKTAVTIYVVSSAFLLIVTFPGPAFPVFLFGPENKEGQSKQPSK